MNPIISYQSPPILQSTYHFRQGSNMMNQNENRPSYFTQEIKGRSENWMANTNSSQKWVNPLWQSQSRISNFNIYQSASKRPSLAHIRFSSYCPQQSRFLTQYEFPCFLEKSVYENSTKVQSTSRFLFNNDNPMLNQVPLISTIRYDTERSYYPISKIATQNQIYKPEIKQKNYVEEFLYAIRQIVMYESELENLRLLLLYQNDYNISNMLQFFQFQNVQEINLSSLKQLYHIHGIEPEDQDLTLIMKRYSRDGNSQLSKEEFICFFQPQSRSQLMYDSKFVNTTYSLSEYTKSLIIKILKLILNTEVGVEYYRKYLQKANVDLKAIFQLIQKQQIIKNYHLKEFFYFNGVYLQQMEIDLLFSRIDRNNSSQINIKEFEYEFSSQSGSESSTSQVQNSQQALYQQKQPYPNQFEQKQGSTQNNNSDQQLQKNQQTQQNEQELPKSDKQEQQQVQQTQANSNWSWQDQEKQDVQQQNQNKETQEKQESIQQKFSEFQFDFAQFNNEINNGKENNPKDSEKDNNVELV